MLLHYLVKLKTWKLYLFTLLLHVDLPVDTQVTSELSPNNCWTIFHSQNDRMCVPNKTKKGNREQGIQLPVSHALIDHHICHGVRPLGAMSRMEVFLHQA